jgi:hypothetical protein
MWDQLIFIGGVADSLEHPPSLLNSHTHSTSAVATPPTDLSGLSACKLLALQEITSGRVSQRQLQFACKSCAHRFAGRLGHRSYVRISRLRC